MPAKPTETSTNMVVILLKLKSYETDQNLLEIPAKIDTRHWSAVITYRSDDIRIISVRRSRREEVVLYES